MKLLLLLFISIASIVSTSSFAIEGVRFCGGGDYASISHFSFHNNIYGAKSLRDARKNYRQCTTATLKDELASFQIQWEFPPFASGIKSYPHVTYGWDWKAAQLFQKIPAALTSIKSMRFSHSVVINSNDRLNVAYDIWISNEIDPKRSNLTDEVMIWIIDQNTKILEKPIGSVFIRGNNFDLVHRKVRPEVGNWNYFAFVSKHPLLVGEIDVIEFLSYLRDKKLLAGTILNGVSFGPELIEGSGSIVVDGFKLEKFE